MSRLIRKTCARRRKAASGQVVIETIASILMFTLMLATVMSISVYLYFQQALVTAAREGARHAALDTDLGDADSESDGITRIEGLVADEIQQLTGQSFSPSVATITVTPPSSSSDQTPGRRNVRVDITWNMTNPVGVGAFMDALGADGTAFKTIPVSASATMRYEE